MSLLHPSPRKERNQTPIHRIIATITSSNCHFLLNLNSSFLFVSFLFFCFAFRKL